MNIIINKTNALASVRERTIPTERLPVIGEVSVTFGGWSVLRGQHTDPYGCILVFLDGSRYFFFQVAPQLCSRV
jgi:hypothetical protein